MSKRLLLKFIFIFLIMVATPIVIKPQPGPQEAFLATPADIAIYGGAAGGGKTWGLLLEPIRHLNNPDFGAVIFRRISKEVTNEGGMWDESSKIYPHLPGAQPNQTHLRWSFESGSRIRFAHMQYADNRFDWQGAQIPLIGFDELTHFEEIQFWYMLSRNRSTCGVRPYVRATTNPDADSWVAGLVAWWVNQDTGYPIPERSGALRWFYRYEGTLSWANSPEELYRLHPEIIEIAHESDRSPRDLIRSITFIPARLDDNLALKLGDPSYLANLMALPVVERERLLEGNWKVRAAAGKVFNRYWFDIIPGPPPRGGTYCRFWDFAATEKKLKGDNPAYTAGALMAKVGDLFYIVDQIAVQLNPAETDSLFFETCQKDREEIRQMGGSYRVRWEQEGGASGKRDSHRLVRELAGYDAKGISPSGDKISRAKPLAVQAEHGYVKIIKASWNEQVLIHLHHQPDWDYKDIMDSLSGAFTELTTGPSVAKVQVSGLYSSRRRQ